MAAEANVTGGWVEWYRPLPAAAGVISTLSCSCLMAGQYSRLASWMSLPFAWCPEGKNWQKEDDGKCSETPYYCRRSVGAN